MATATGRPTQLLELFVYSNGWVKIVAPKIRGNTIVPRFGRLMTELKMEWGVAWETPVHHPSGFWAYPPSVLEDRKPDDLVRDIKAVYDEYGYNVSVRGPIKLERKFIQSGELD